MISVVELTNPMYQDGAVSVALVAAASSITRVRE
jgi:hypothetical protein